MRLKRIYDEASPSDGVRVLVDRIWPRGVSKRDAMVDRWMKDIAPSTELRKWFNHESSRWREFKRRYFLELKQERFELVEELTLLAAKKTVTLVYSTRDQEHNQARALLEYLSRESKS